MEVWDEDLFAEEKEEVICVWNHHDGSEMSNREGRGWDVENEGSLYDS